VLVSTVYDQALYAVDLVAEQVDKSVVVGAGAVEIAQEPVLAGELFIFTIAWRRCNGRGDQPKR
jgi:hypothetical protein